MSSYTSVTGEIIIEPALTWPAAKDIPFDDADADGLPVWSVRLEAEEVPGAPGTFTARRLISADVEWLDGYDLESDVQDVIDAFPGHRFTGLLKCMGADHWDDMWGVVARGRTAARVEPVVTWPGDTTVTE